MIRSLNAEDAHGNVERLLTVEVRNYTREIVQARGTFNRMPLPEEEYMLGQWACKSELRLTNLSKD